MEHYVLEFIRLMVLYITLAQMASGFRNYNLNIND
jgi:hypothetical protein